MNVVVQLDMFRETTEEDVLNAKLNALEESHHAVRRRAFAEIRQVTTMMLTEKERNDKQEVLIAYLKEEIEFLKVKLGLACAIQAGKDP